MKLASLMGAGWTAGPQLLSDNEGILLCRACREGIDGSRDVVLAVVPAAEQPKTQDLDRLRHEYELREELDGGYAAKPLELVQDSSRSILVLEDFGGEPLTGLVGSPMEIGTFLQLAIQIAEALGKVHQHDLVHKDVKPANILLNHATGNVRLTGFGFASRRPRERQLPAPPESIGGTLAYMAPEQTGRMNRSIDSRADLYSLGVTLYQLLTGSLPFMASDPMEWVHCHIARQPVPPRERVQSVPAPVSAIIMKLLAKTAEDRYQTAIGVARDLERCLAEWNIQRRMDPFPLGEHDSSDRLRIPETLYGRAREVECLLTAFDRVVETGSSELVLVTGYSGIGKSSVVNELHKMLVAPRGLFAAGKFDQYKRDIPYSTLAQAFQSLIHPLLGKSDAELSGWRDAFQDALGPNGRLIADLVPELKLIIGEQPPVPELPPQQAQGRFQLILRRFIGVFARPERPLALFLDDLQWLDAATLDLLEDLLTRPDVRHLMLVGAYRDNEVDFAHPLMRRLAAIRSAHAVVHEITLTPLTCDSLERLIADAVRCEPERAAPLAQLVHEKTAGNPFFAIQFIGALAEEGLLAFDHDAARWSWDLERIRAEAYTDNVADLMVSKLNRLALDTQNTLQQLACLGMAADLSTLATVNGRSEEEVRDNLQQPASLGLIEILEDSCRFVHDRVREAAYSSIPQEQRAKHHLRIGRLLEARTAPESLEEAIFEIVNQLNRATHLLTSQGECDHLGELNLLAGKRAKASSAYASALGYLIAGAALMSADAWDRRHELAFQLDLNRAECEFLNGDLAAARDRLAALSARAADAIELAAVTCLRIDVSLNLGQGPVAVAFGLEYLRQRGLAWSPHPTEQEVRREYELIWSHIGETSIEQLVELPLMSDPLSLATVDVLTALSPPAFFTDANLHSLVTCRLVNLSLEHGNADGSCVAHVWLGAVAGGYFEDYKAGYQFGRLGYELVQRRRLTGFQGRTYLGFATTVLPWTKHVRSGRDVALEAFKAANKAGDLACGSYSCEYLNGNLLAAGDPLAEAQSEAENGLRYAETARFSPIVPFMMGELQLIRTLRGLTPVFGSFADENFDQTAFERNLCGNPALGMAESWYLLRRLQALFLAGEFAAALQASTKAQPILVMTPLHFEAAEYHFYSALARAANCHGAPSNQPSDDIEALAAHHRQLEKFARNCPENFENRAALVGAEIARIEGRKLEAEELYEQAIRSARAHGFIHNEALANELAARFYAARGFEKTAHAYLRDAHYGYHRWGADAKVRQLERLHPRLHVTEDGGSVGKVTDQVQRMDVTTVVKASQAVSTEIELPRLIETLMKIALQNAGADRGLLILARHNDFWIKAEGQSRGDEFSVVMCDTPISGPDCPEALLRYVIRAQKTLILDDTSEPDQLCDREYVKRRHPRSILCLPLMKQANLTGLLYFENALATHAFTPDRVAVLELLAAQAAISLENTLLYHDLQEMQLELAHANRVATMGQLTSSIAHEVNQPISAVSINADAALNWLSLKPPEIEEARVSIEQVIKDAHRSSEVLARTRALVKKAPRPKERFDLNEAIREVIALTGSEALKSGVAVKTQLAEGLSLIKGDRVQLQQVLLNLVVNATQAMAATADGTRDLLITAAPAESNFVLVRVADSGPGLEPQMLEHVFDPYYTTKSEGLGMGLAICRSIIDAHNGRLWASANEPRGAVFQFTLPADPGA